VTIGVIGYGRFGEFAVRHLSRRVRVLVYDSRRANTKALPKGAHRAKLAEVAGQQVVLLAVPVSSLRSLLSRIRRNVQPEALVVDVCAVKSAPVSWMKDLLPAEVGILGTHPFFGPDSARKRLRGKMIVLCPVRVSSFHLARVLTELHRVGLETIFMSPIEHDRLMAETILLTQYVGRLVDRLGAHQWPSVTTNYASLRSIVETVRHDTTQLFTDMVEFNPFGKKLARSFRQAARALEREARHRHR
jgi:prephenate dehydrogenase